MINDWDAFLRNSVVRSGWRAGQGRYKRVTVESVAAVAEERWHLPRNTKGRISPAPRRGAWASSSAFLSAIRHGMAAGVTENRPCGSPGRLVSKVPECQIAC